MPEKVVEASKKVRVLREKAFSLLVILLFIVLFIQLARLQLFSHKKFLARAIGNKIQAVKISAPRGDIYDRSGTPLALNKPLLALKYFPREQNSKRKAEGSASPSKLTFTSVDSADYQVILEVSKHFKVPLDKILKRVERDRQVLYPYEPVTLIEGLGLPEVVHFEENRQLFPGAFVETNNFVRYYPLAESAVHLVGYVGLPSKEEVLSKGRPYAMLTEAVGREGIERSLNEILAGMPGIRYIEVDKTRRFRGEIKLESPVKGKDVYLTIDSQIQRKAFELLNARPGAIIAMNPKNGEVLALVSSPSYDPNRFRGELGAIYLEKILSKRDYPPMLNRAVGNAYAPGSTFKPVVLLSALENKKVTSEITFFCSGKLEIGNRIFYCWNRDGHGTVNLVDAVGKSCDLAFYRIGLMLGPHLINETAGKFLFGQSLGTMFPNVAKGLLPTPAWKRRHYSQPPYKEVDRRWYEGDTANLAIGQGFVLATPMQIITMINAIANDGILVYPMFVKGVKEGDEIKPFEERKMVELGFEKENIRIVKRGLERSVMTGGTADGIPSYLKVAGKTGTAEVWKGEPHSWFVGYMPYDDPKVSFVVFLENGGSSRLNAVPLARELAEFLKSYLNL